MEHAGDGGKFLDDGKTVPVGFPIMDDHRQIQLHRQCQLLAEYRLLKRSGRIVLPVVVQSDLPDSHHLGLLQKLTQLRQILVLEAVAVLRMDAHGGVHMRVPFRQLCRRMGGGQVASRVQHQSHASPRHGGKERIPVAVKAVRVIMGMGIKNRHNPLPRSFFVPVYTESGRLKRKTVGGPHGFLNLILLIPLAASP